MRSFLYQNGKMTQQFSNAYSSFSLYNCVLDKKNPKINKNIQTGLKALFKDNIGLQSVLRNDGGNIIDRTLIGETEGCPPCPSDSKSTKSESTSQQTYISSVSNGVNSKQSNADIVTQNTINDEDMIQKYYKELRNSLKNCILTKKPSVSFKDVAGNSYAKKIIQEAFVLPNLIPGYFAGKPKPWNKILLYGPPGVGKTMLAKAVCNEVNATVFWVSLAEITSKFIGESEKLLRMLFELARERSPSIIIIDEMDSIGRKRNGNESETERRIKTEFLRQMDEISSGTDGVYVLATTNMPWELDVAALRRFERKILVPMPDEKAREEIFKLHLGNHPHDISDSKFKLLASLTEGYSGSDISTVINDALMKPARMLQETSYFRIVEKEFCASEIQENDINDIDNVEFRQYYTPCFEHEEGAIKMNLVEIPRGRLTLRNVNINDFKESVKNCKPTVHTKFLGLYNKFLQNYGHTEQKGDIFKEDKEYQHYYL